MIAKTRVDVPAAKRIAQALAAKQPNRQPDVLSKTQVNRLINQAAQAGKLGETFFYILMRVPKQYRQGWNDTGWTAAASPGTWVPLVPVEPDPDLGWFLAGLLQQAFAQGNPADHEFVIQVTNAQTIEKAGRRGYVWGSLDQVCPDCGQVNPPAGCCKRSARRQHLTKLLGRRRWIDEQIELLRSMPNED